MNCHTCEDLLSPYADGELSPAENADVEAHLDECEACRDAWAFQQSMLTSLSTWPSSQAPADAWRRMEAALELEDARIDTKDAALDATILMSRAASSASLSPLPTPATPPRATFWESFWEWVRPLALPFAVAGMAVVALQMPSSQVPSRPLTAGHKTPPPRQFVRPRARALIPARVVLKRQANPTRIVMTPRRPRVRRPIVRRALAPQQAAVMAALHSLAMAQQQYQKALTSLELIARRKLQRHKGEAQSRHLLRLLARIDRDIAQVKEIIKQSPKKARAHRTLVAMYQRKVEILRDVVLED